MRRIAGIGFLLTLLLPIVSGAPSSLAQGRHYRWCLQTGSGFECAYNTLRECREAGSGATAGGAGCVRNTSAMNHQ